MRPFRLAAYHTTGAISAVALLVPSPAQTSLAPPDESLAQLSVIALSRVDYVYSSAARIGSETLFESKLGLFKRCDRAFVDSEWKCRRFPKRRLDCPVKPRHDKLGQHFSALMGLRERDDGLFDDPDSVQRENAYFCELWITAGYLAQLSIPFAAVSTVAAIAYTLPQIRNKKRKQHGWKVCAALAALHAALQIASTAIIAHLWRTSNRFTDGSHLASAWILATISYAISVLLVGGLIVADKLALARSRKASFMQPTERTSLLSSSNR